MAALHHVSCLLLVLICQKAQTVQGKQYFDISPVQL